MARLAVAGWAGRRLCCYPTSGWSSASEDVNLVVAVVAAVVVVAVVLVGKPAVDLSGVVGAKRVVVAVVVVDLDWQRAASRRAQAWAGVVVVAGEPGVPVTVAGPVGISGNC